MGECKTVGLSCLSGIGVPQWDGVCGIMELARRSGIDLPKWGCRAKVGLAHLGL